jgi:hypothetical protein
MNKKETIRGLYVCFLSVSIALIPAFFVYCFPPEANYIIYSGKRAQHWLQRPFGKECIEILYKFRTTYNEYIIFIFTYIVYVYYFRLFQIIKVYLNT